MTTTPIALQRSLLSFSGHETFVLRSNWLKKAYDLLQLHPDLFYLEDAFVRLGVGKNMASSIRFWGETCAVFERLPQGRGHGVTKLGTALFNDSNGWDPFLVTPASRWLLHWQIAAHPEAAFSWYYTFNLLRRGEFSAAQLAQHIVQNVAQQAGKIPSPTTLGRDIDCMLRCYLRPDLNKLGLSIEDALHCPLHELDLIQALPEQSLYRLVSTIRADLPDALLAYAALHQARALVRTTLTFNELAYAERSPGRIFRLDEDALLARLLHFEQLTHGQAIYSETGGIRQLAWRNLEDDSIAWDLLEQAFAL